jgi:hypothetical protein
LLGAADSRVSGLLLSERSKHSVAGVEVAMRGIGSRASGLVCTFILLIPPSATAQGTSGPTIRDSSVGYVDPALIGDEVRFRYDTSYDLNRPTRAEFFWSPGGVNGPGPRLPESSVDYQDLSTYIEKQFGERVSGFVEVPVRFLNPENNANAAGLADMNAGFKFALLQSDEGVATFQLRGYFPTGNVAEGLGNDHVTLEPAFLFYKRLAEGLAVEGELRDWIPLTDDSFAGNIVRYGIGVHYDVYQTCNLQIVPVVELVGWTVLSGRETVLQPSGAGLVQDAAGDTIVNVKIGCRFKMQEWGDLYVGYGRPLTGDRWYESTYRVEFRLYY